MRVFFVSLGFVLGEGIIIVFESTIESTIESTRSDEQHLGDLGHYSGGRPLRGRVVDAIDAVVLWLHVTCIKSAEHGFPNLSQSTIVDNSSKIEGYRTSEDHIV